MESVATAGSSTATSVARPLTRLVVLPFRLLRPDPEIDFLSFALADAVSASLAGLPSVVLRSSATAARFATDSPDLKALATQADVDRVLMGTLLRAGEQLRATAQLVEAPAGTLVSSQTLQAPLGDVFSLQDELARRIVESLSPSLSEREGTRRRGVPASARAYEFYLRANEVVRDRSHVTVARDLYRQCVDEDASFAPGWARLGRCHRLLAKYFLEQPEENLARADEAYRRALDLDPDLPVAHKLYAHREAEIGRARDAMVRLLGLARTTRNDPEIFAGLVHACRYCGLLEASEAAHREARRLDPHISTSVVYTWWARGDMERVIEETSDAGDFELRTMAFVALGREDEARKTLELPATSFSPVFAAIKKALRGDDRSEGGGRRPVRRARGHALRPRGHVHVRGLPGPRRRHRARAVGSDGLHPRRLRRAAGDGTSLARVDPGQRPRRAGARAEASRHEAEQAFREAGGPRSARRLRGRLSRLRALRRRPAAEPRLPAAGLAGGPRRHLALHVEPAVREQRHEGPDRGDRRSGQGAHHAHRQRELRHDPVLLPHDHPADVALVDEPLDLVHELAALPPDRLPRRALRHVVLRVQATTTVR